MNKEHPFELRGGKLINISPRYSNFLLNYQLMSSAPKQTNDLNLLTPDQYLRDSCPEEITNPNCANSALASSGFVVLKQLIDKRQISKLRDAFYLNIIPSKSKFGRIYTYRGLQSNNISEQGHLLNPLSNPQLESEKNNSKEENSFIRNVINLIAYGPHIPVIKKATGHAHIRLLTWNLFHVVEPFTPPHQDCIFFNSYLSLFDLLGVWIALEDIPAGASPLYLQRYSHTNLAEFAKKHESISPEYTSELAENLLNNKNQIIAPSLQAGDCIIWDSRTVHGSLLRTDLEATRLSITAHFEPERTSFLSKLQKFESSQYRNLSKRRLLDLQDIKKITLDNDLTVRVHRSRVNYFNELLTTESDNL